MNITLLSAPRRLTFSIVKQLPFATTPILSRALQSNNILGFIKLPKYSVYLLKDNDLYYIFKKVYWKHEPGSLTLKCGVYRKNFPTLASLESFLEEYKTLTNLNISQIFI